MFRIIFLHFLHIPLDSAVLFMYIIFKITLNMEKHHGQGIT